MQHANFVLDLPLYEFHAVALSCNYMQAIWKKMLEKFFYSPNNYNGMAVKIQSPSTSMEMEASEALTLVGLL